MKDSGGKLENLLRCMSLQGGAFNTASGNDGDILAALALGIDACVSGNANFVPELVVALYEAASSGDPPRARELQAQVNAVRRLLEGATCRCLRGCWPRVESRSGRCAPLVPAPDDVIRDSGRRLRRLACGVNEADYFLPSLLGSFPERGKEKGQARTCSPSLRLRGVGGRGRGMGGMRSLLRPY